MARCRMPALVAVLAMGGVSAAWAARISEVLEGDWQFQREDVPTAGKADFDASGWQTVRLPHTWTAPDAERGGAYYRGVGWYRHVF